METLKILMVTDDSVSKSALIESFVGEDIEINVDITPDADKALEELVHNKYRG